MKVSWMFACLIFIGFFSSCEGDKKEENDAFDRKALLTNYVDNLIVPNFTRLAVSSDSLHKASIIFCAQPNQINLLQIQNQWKSTVSAWQYCAPYNFGPAETLYGTLKDFIGIFPADPTQINNLIAKGDTVLKTSVESLDARGLMAVEYLIFDSLNRNEEIIEKYAESKNNKTAYLKNLTLDINIKSKETVNGWKANRDNFISDDGINAGSSISLLFNNMVRDFERIKNFKIALPLGKQAPFPPTPKAVEAYYSGFSLTLAKENYRAIEECWRGKSNAGIDGIGFEDYLLKVYGGPALVSETNIQIAAVYNAFSIVPLGRLSETINSNPAPVEKLYIEISRNTRLFKSDLSSLLGIAVTFSSADGD